VERDPGDDRVPRRRRSALQTPAFVERIDLPDDAEGRVAIFTVDAGPFDAAPREAALDGRVPKPGREGHPVLDRLGSWLDGRYAGVAIAALLAVVLALGLLFLRH
jgi:hypothetical protein